MFTLGVFDAYDTLCPESVPEVGYIGYNQERTLASHIDRSWDRFTDPEQDWVKLQPSIKILSKVCPKAAFWVQEQHEKKRLLWESSSNGTLAHFSFVDRTVTLNEAMLKRTHGEIACTLAHEFRHSLQHRTKRFKAILYLIVVKKYKEEIIERDAYDFERQVYLAIFD